MVGYEYIKLRKKSHILFFFRREGFSRAKEMGKWSGVISFSSLRGKLFFLLLLCICSIEGFA